MRRAWQVLQAATRVLRAKRHNPLWIGVLADECQALGGIYIKFMQQLATTELVSAEFRAMGRRLGVFDEVATEPIDIRAVLVSELGPKAERLTVTETPFATGSFAQVHHCSLADDPRRFALKVLRPSVMQHLDTDCRLIMIACRIGQLFMRTDLLDLPTFAGEFINATRRETDYLYEQEMARYARDYFHQRNAHIYVPEMIEEYATRHILLQEYIDGLPLTTVVEAAQQGSDTRQLVAERIGSDLDRQLVTISSEVLTATLQADWIMADPHPGNFLLLPDNRVAMIDFGLMAPAPTRRSTFLHMIRQYRSLYENRADFGALAVAMIAFYDFALYQALEMTARQRSLTTGLYGYINSVAAAGAVNSQAAEQRQITQLFLRELNAGNRFALRLDSDHIVVQRALYQVLATVRLACGEAHRRDRYWRIVHTALITTEASAQQHGVKDDAPTRPPSQEEAREIVTDWLSIIAERDQLAYQTLLQRGAI